MLTAVACIALAAGVLVAPTVTARARLAALHPQPRRRSRLRAVSVAPIIAGSIAGFVVAGPGGALAGALVATITRRRRARNRRAATTAAVTEQLADALGRVSDELRTGSHPAAALAGIEADGPLACDVLAPAAAAAGLGDDVAAAMHRSAATHPEVASDLVRLAGAWSLAEQHGVPLAELLADAQADLRWRVRFGAAVRAQLAGPRATAMVLTALPLLGVLLGQMLGADPIGVLRAGFLGQVLVVLGVGLAAAGALWSERIMQSAVPR